MTLSAMKTARAVLSADIKVMPLIAAPCTLLWVFASVLAVPISLAIEATARVGNVDFCFNIQVANFYFFGERWGRKCYYKSICRGVHTVSFRNDAVHLRDWL